MRKKIKIRLKTVEADTLTHFLLFSIKKIKEQQLKNGDLSAIENRFLKTFASFIMQVNLTPQEEDQAIKDAEAIDKNYNTAKKN